MVSPLGWAPLIPSRSLVPVAFAAGDPEGGYPPDCAPLTFRSPSSPSAETLKVSVLPPPPPAPLTVPVWAENASLAPAELEPVTPTRTVEPTSAATRV